MTDNVQDGNFHGLTGEPDSETLISSWMKTLSYLDPLPDAPNAFSPGIRLVPREIKPVTYNIYAPLAIGNIIYAKLNGPGWFGTVIIESVLPDQTRIFARVSQLTEITVTGDQVTRGQLIGHIDFSQAAYLRFEISPSGILSSEPVHWGVIGAQIIKKHYIDPTNYV